MAEVDERISSPQQLVRRFTAASKSRDAFAVGVEHEKIGVLADAKTPVPYHGEQGIAALFDAFLADGWQAVREDGHAIALERAGEKITLEPGGQLELSGLPAKTAHEAGAEVRGHLEELGRRSRPFGLRWLGVGFRPFGTREDISWVPKRRYVVMREVLPLRGRLAHDMMKRTATVQANLDWADEADAARKFRVAMGVTSIVTALYACSPIVEGQDTGYQSYRARVWLETDPDRCGLLPFAFDADRDHELFQRYTEWALDVPMLFLYRDGYRRVDNLPFRRFMSEGHAGEHATVADWDLHLSTLFPEARLKHYLEVRGADAGPVENVLALPALWRGLLYDDAATDEAIALTQHLSYAERVQLREDVPRGGLETVAGGTTVGVWAKELVAIARRGLVRLGAGEESLLDPLAEIAETGRTAADRVRDVFRATKGDPQELLQAFSVA
jgi:glutamate--cysteine ligase